MKNDTIKRKQDHINLCLNGDVTFKQKTNGFEYYDFEHYAITEVDLDNINLNTSFFKKKISYPFLISCMTGGTSEAEKLNEKLAIAANHLNIPIGVGSQRQALEDKSFHNSYKVVRKNAGNVPVLGNLGAAEIVKSRNAVNDVKKLIDLIEANAFVIHINPLQELLQMEGDPHFSGLLKSIELLTSKIKIPFIAKEVGSGISKVCAKELLNAGIKCIDVAGSGGTSWTAVELIRNNSDENYFREWGLPTSYCLRTIADLKKNHKFMLISSGGINNFDEIAKSLLLGADIVGSARKILLEVNSNGVDGVIHLITNWFESIKKIMFLTGSKDIQSFKKKKLIRKSELF